MKTATRPHNCFPRQVLPAGPPDLVTDIEEAETHEK